LTLIFFEGEQNMRTVKIIGLIGAVVGLLTAIVILLTEGIKLARELPSQSSQPPAVIATEQNSVSPESNSSYSFPSTSNNPPVEFFNEWVNINPQTDNIKRISIQAKDGGTYLNMFGACSPTDCNFREYLPAPGVNYNYDSETGILHVEWVFDFQTMLQELTITSEEQLRVKTFNHFTDNSGRADFEMVDYFTRQ